jgi:hypothetical protein
LIVLQASTKSRTGPTDFLKHLRFGLTAQSFHGSNSASPAIATANGRKVCNTFVEAAWYASTSGSRR